MVKENGVPTVVDRVAPETTGGSSAMLRVNVPVPVPAELLAEMLTVNVPACVGVPEMSPVVVFTLSPVGRPVAL
jgi:hypothetical protein